MLKIKDNIDLKELKKFGFIEQKNVKYPRYDLVCDEVTVEVYIEDRDIYLFSTGAEEVQGMSIPQIIFDLIKADLVEKVSD